MSPISAALAGYVFSIATPEREMGFDMRETAAELAKNTVAPRGNDRTLAGESVALDRRYGQIGISAVAAAVRYQGSAKNPAYAPTSTKWRDALAEVAA